MNTTEEKTEFAFTKKLGMADCMYGNIPFLIKAIERLLVCMHETNELHGVSCEFFRLDFRDSKPLDNLPMRSLCFDMKWGSKKEIDEKDKSNE